MTGGEGAIGIEALGGDCTGDGEDLLSSGVSLGIKRSMRKSMLSSCLCHVAPQVEEVLMFCRAVYI